MNRYYEPSGKFSFLSFLLFILTITIVIPILSLAYSYATWYIPFVYINFFITAGFGFLVGWVVSKTVIRWGKVRNGKLALVFGLLTGLFALYMQWGVWLDLVLNAGEHYGSKKIGITVSNISFLQTFNLLFSPSSMKELIGAVNETGTWGIRTATVSGIFLTIIWVIEAFIIVIMPLFMVHSASQEPFCEQANQWAKETEIKGFQYVENPAEFKLSLESGQSTIFNHLEMVENVEEANHSTFTLFHCEHVDTYYLSVTNNLATIDKEGKTDFSNDIILEYLTISPIDGRNLLSKNQSKG